MKKNILIIGLTLLVTAAFSFTYNVKNTNFPLIEKVAASIIKWERTSMSFGEIKKGKPVNTTFIFTNTGSAPLVISSVKTSCGCTASNWTRDAIQPGEKSEITATYNAARLGAFTKTIRVMSNSETPVTTLTISGKVVE